MRPQLLRPNVDILCLQEVSGNSTGKGWSHVAGGLIDEALEVLFPRAHDFGRSTGARAVDQAQRALVGKALAPLAQGGIGNLERVGDGVEALPFDDGAHGLGTAEDTRLLGWRFLPLFDEAGCQALETRMLIDSLFDTDEDALIVVCGDFKWRPCMPAMAVGLTDHVWSVREVLWPQPQAL
jgi:hypothetical protein